MRYKTKKGFAFLLLLSFSESLHAFDLMLKIRRQAALRDFPVLSTYFPVLISVSGSGLVFLPELIESTVRILLLLALV
jgi:hypothetical protein